MATFTIDNDIAQIDAAIKSHASRIVIDVSGDSELLQAAANAFPRMLHVTHLQIHSRRGANLPKVRVWPPSLVELVVRSWQPFRKVREHIFTFDTLLPETLLKLICNHTCIGQLPGKLPPNLLFLAVKNCNLTSLPRRLPTGLLHLDASFNAITQVQKLPSRLKRLLLAHNAIEALPELPSRLRYLDVGTNNFGELPDHLPEGIKYLNVSYNKLSDLPHLPKKLVRLCASHNFLIDLPPTLPHKLKYMNVRNNYITDIDVDSLPATLVHVNVQWNRMDAVICSRLPGQNKQHQRAYSSHPWYNEKN